MCRLHTFFILDSHLATLWENNCPFGFPLVMFLLGSSYFVFMFLSLWCLWWEVWDNRIGSWSLPSLLFHVALLEPFIENESIQLSSVVCVRTYDQSTEHNYSNTSPSLRKKKKKKKKRKKKKKKKKKKREKRENIWKPQKVYIKKTYPELLTREHDGTFLHSWLDKGA